MIDRETESSKDASPPPGSSSSFLSLLQTRFIFRFRSKSAAKEDGPPGERLSADPGGREESKREKGDADAVSRVNSWGLKAAVECVTVFDLKPTDNAVEPDQSPARKHRKPVKAVYRNSVCMPINAARTRETALPFSIGGGEVEISLYS
jgi:hypothetical protein